MSKDVQVSIIVPVYNTAQYLQKCLDSLKNQTLKDLEFICVDDGSTDESYSMLMDFAKADDRFKIIKQKNQGQSVARNSGLSIATGEYIGFLDSDDYADETMFEKLYLNAVKFDSDISMCSILINNERTGELTSKDPYMTLDLFPSEFENVSFNYTMTTDFLFRICVTPWNKIYKKSFLEEKAITFPMALNFEDNVFFYETYMQAQRVSLVKEPLIVYRKESSTSYTFGKNDYKKLDFFGVFEKIEEFLKDKNLYLEFEAKFETYRRNTLIYWYKKLNDKKVIEEYKNRFIERYNEAPEFYFDKVVKL